jgi:hypothetical protein
VIGKERGSQNIANLLVTNVPRCTGSNAKTLGPKHLQFPDMVANGGPPEGARVVYQRTDEVLVQQNTIPEGETTSQHSQSLYHFPPHLIDVRRPGKPRSKVHPQDKGRYRPRGLAPEELKWSRFRDAPSGLSEEHISFLRDIDPFSQPPF